MASTKRRRIRRRAPRRRFSLTDALLEFAFSRIVAGMPGMPPVPPPAPPPVMGKRIALPPVNGHAVTLEIP